MSQTMTKEVTKTIVNVAKIELVNGEPKSIKLPDEVFIGNLSQERVQKLLNKKYQKPVTVYGIKTEKTKYQMPIEEFIEIAKPVVSDEH